MLNTSARGCRVFASCSSSKTGHLFPHHFNLSTVQSCCVSGSPFSYGKRKRKPLSQSALNNEDVYADLINFDAPPNATIIDLPKQIVRKDAKRTEYKTKKNVEFYRKYGVDRTRSHTVISARGLKGADLSHYDGQRYDLTLGLKKDDRKTPVKGSLQLVAEKWLKNTSRGQSFTINQMKRKKSLLDRNDDVADEPDTFTGILPTDRDWVQLSKLLEIKCGIVKPTSVQAKSLKPALTGRHVYVAAETGSGKTLCYVLPLMHKIMKRRLTETGKSTVAVLLLPTHELAVQVTGVIQSLAERLSHPISVGTAEENPDIVIGAPQRIANWIERGLLNPESVETAVIDEADTLLDDSFCDSTARALTRLRILNDSATEEEVTENEDELLESNDADGRPRCQVLLASATLTTDLDAALASIGLEPNDVSVICSKHVGYLMHSRSRHTFLRVTAPMKAEQLLLRLRQMLRPPGRNPAKLSKPVKKPPRPSIMIFVNRTMTATWLHEFLDRSGFECVLLSKEVKENERDANFEAFRSGAVPILVCTDVTSRGVDITQVTHVINYDFPVQLVDYVHRAGRVGRVNQKNVTGTIISFVQKRSDVNHVCTIERSIRLGTALRGLDTNTPRLADEHDEMKKRQREAV